MGMCWMDTPDADGKEKAFSCLEEAAELGYIGVLVYIASITIESGKIRALASKENTFLVVDISVFSSQSFLRREEGFSVFVLHLK
jgi:hypothetical protein